MRKNYYDYKKLFLFKKVFEKVKKQKIIDEE